MATLTTIYRMFTGGISYFDPVKLLRRKAAPWTVATAAIHNGRASAAVTSKVFYDAPHIPHYYYGPKEYSIKFQHYENENRLIFKPEFPVNRIEAAENLSIPTNK